MAAVSPHHVLRVDNFDKNHDSNLDHVLGVDHFDNNLLQLVHLAASGHLHLTRVVVHVAVAAAHRPVPLRPRASLGGNCHHYLILPSAQPPVIRARRESQITT